LFQNSRCVGRGSHRVCCESVYCSGAEVLQEVCFGVSISSWRKEWVEHLLQLRIDHGSEQIDRGRTKRTQGLQQLLSCGDRAAIAGGDAHDLADVRQCHCRNLRAEFVRRRCYEVTIETE